MKNILFATALVIFIAAGCGTKNKRTEVPAHVHTESCSHGRSNVADESKHEHGPGCDHDHSGHDHSHEGHDHGSDTGHNHSNDGHAHGVDCDHDHSAGAHNHGENPGEVVFTRQQAAATDFEVQRVTAGPFRESVRVAGIIAGAAADRQNIVAPVSGIVSFVRRDLSDGKKVGAGETLFRVSSAGLTDGDVASRALSTYNLAKANLDRISALAEERIASRREYEEALNEFEQARIAYEALAPNISGNAITVRSTREGFISDLGVTEGEYVEVGRTLVTVSRNNDLTLRAELPARYASLVSSVSDATILVPYSGVRYRLSDLGIRSVTASRVIPQGSATIPVTINFDAPATVIPGMITETYLLGKERGGVISVPETALIEQLGLYYVYVQIEDEVYMRREVAPGASDGINREIISGLTPGEKVVARGAVNLRMAAASGDIPHGHEH